MTKRYTIAWSPTAQRDFDQLLAYLVERDSFDAAVDLHERLLAQVARLAVHPYRCRIPPELLELGVAEYRELVSPPYRVFFRIQASKVGIVGVLDRRRNLQDLLLQRLLAAD